MKNEKVSFPKKFLWGSSISAFQAEGAWNEKGKGVSVADIRSAKSKNLADSKVAIDFYHHYKEDVQLMVKCGLKSFRFSIAWTRIFPHGNDEVANETGLQFYDDLIDELIKNHIEPVITLYHFDYPQALIEKYGGWLSRQSIDDFVRYAKTLFLRYGDRVTYWTTINEQGVLATDNTLLGIEATDLEEIARAKHQMNYHMFLAHAKVVKLCHEMLPHAKIAPVLSCLTIYPATSSPKDVLASMETENMMNLYLMDVYMYGKYPKYYLNFLKEHGWMFKTEKGDEEILKGAKIDFIALNWYQSKVTTIPKENSFKEMLEKNPQLLKIAPKYYGVPRVHQFVPNPYTKANEWGWEVDPVGFQIILRKLYQRYRLPIMITENGLGHKDLCENNQIHDDYRIDYLKQHVTQMKKAIEAGVEIIGYHTWSFLDLINVNDGMEKRYGLVYVERDNQNIKQLKRICKDSYHWYAHCISVNGDVEDE